MKTLPRLLFAAACLLWTACSTGPDVAGHSGGTDETGNALTGVSGRVVDANGAPVPGAVVLLHPEMAPSPEMKDADPITLITDSTGSYHDSDLAPTTYIIEIQGPGGRGALNRVTLPSADTLVSVGTDTLKPCGAIQGWLTVKYDQLPDSFGVFEAVIWNLNIVKPVQKEGYFLIQNLPEGVYRFRIQAQRPGFAMIDTSNITVRSGETTGLDIVNMVERLHVTGGPAFAADTVAVRAILDSNGLTDLVSDVIWVINGRVAYLKCQRDFSVIPDDIAKLDRLEYLGLLGTGNTSAPLRVSARLSELDSLKVLELIGQRLADVPTAVGGLACLEELDLSFNNIDGLPAFLFTLPRLTSLRAEINRLTALPPAIDNLSGLRSLVLSGNSLSTLPPEIGRLTSLSILWVNNNRLDSLPGTLGRLRMLKELSLRENNLAALPDSVVRLNCQVDVTWNRLCNVTGPVAAWLDNHYRRYFDPADSTRWRDTQCK
ncbi:MAG: carboxypeptidase regulatory-like domain-containing protein [Fibrobacterota bacterium]